MPEPITVIEHDKSGASNVDGKAPGSTKIYKAWRSDDALAVRLAVGAVAPLTDEYGCLLIGADFQPQGGGVWLATIKYGLGEREGTSPLGGGQGGGNNHNPTPQDPLGPECTFDTTGGTLHITQSIKTKAAVLKQGDNRGFPNLGPQANFGGQAIGVSKSGIAGCDILVPKFSWTETWRFPIDSITRNYAIRLRDMTGMVNKVKWRNFEAGEVVFAGATGSNDGTTKYRVAYTFHSEKNRTGLAAPEVGEGGIIIADGFPAIDKDGWDYLWIAYEQFATNDAEFAVARAAFVDQVYYRQDFVRLGIGN